MVESFLIDYGLLFFVCFCFMVIIKAMDDATRSQAITEWSRTSLPPQSDGVSCLIGTLDEPI